MIVDVGVLFYLPHFLMYIHVFFEFKILCGCIWCVRARVCMWRLFFSSLRNTYFPFNWYLLNFFSINVYMILAFYFYFYFILSFALKYYYLKYMHLVHVIHRYSCVMLWESILQFTWMSFYFAYFVEFFGWELNIRACIRIGLFHSCDCITCTFYTHIICIK